MMNTSPVYISTLTINTGCIPSNNKDTSAIGRRKLQVVESGHRAKFMENIEYWIILICDNIIKTNLPI